MILEILIALLFGIIAGTFTGLLPGIHINLVSAFVVSSSAYFLGFAPAIAVISFLVAMAITHTFIDFIPSIFLGAPDEDSFLAILPGHELLNEGKGYEAIVLTGYGGLTALFLLLILTPLFILFLPSVYFYAERIMPIILIITCIFLIYFEKSSRILAFIVFSLSGILGLATLNLSMKESLLPLFTGLFGVSSLITSISKKQKLSEQHVSELSEIKVSKKAYGKSLAASLIASPLCSFLPGLGSGQAAIIGSEVIGELERKEFLILLGIINTLVTGLSFVALYSINKARTGIAVAVGKLLEISASDLIIILVIIIFSGFISFFLVLLLGKLFCKFLNKINYSVLSIIVIALLINITILFSGFLGLAILVVSTCLGLFCIYSGVRRTHLMGSLIVPAILLYLL